MNATSTHCLMLMEQISGTATLALTSLLKTGNESNVERLVKQITSFMNDITDVFKIEVVCYNLVLMLAFRVRPPPLDLGTGTTQRRKK